MMDNTFVVWVAPATSIFSIHTITTPLVQMLRARVIFGNRDDGSLAAALLCGGFGVI